MCARCEWLRFYKYFFGLLFDPFSTHSSEQPDAKKAKGDGEEEEFNLADISEGSVSSVRSWVGRWGLDDETIQER